MISFTRPSLKNIKFNEKLKIGEDLDFQIRLILLNNEKEILMKKKTLAQLDGIIGLVTGTILTILPIIIIMIASIFDDEEVVGVILGIIFIIFSLVKIGILILGILSLIYYKDDNRISIAPSVLLIVGSALALVPFLGWIGGIVIIVGASLFLGSLKKFKVEL